jgi:hypothetical protein
MGSIAFLGAAYFNAGISKVVFGGFEWLSGVPIQAAIVAQDGLVADSVVSAYRIWVVNTPVVAALFSVLTVGFELGGPLMIAGRRIRFGVVVGLLGMHLNLYVLTPILYWEAMVLLVLFGLSAERWEAHSIPAPTRSILAGGRVFAATVALLALCAVVVIGHQAAQFTRLRGPTTARVEPPPPAAVGGPPAINAAPAPPSPSAPQQVGPFAVGQSVTDTWVIDALTVTHEVIIVALTSRLGRARFEVTCHSEHRSPFDLGPAHILYSQHTEFGALEGAGWALRQRLEEAAEGADVCERLADWRRSVQ